MSRIAVRVRLHVLVGAALAAVLLAIALPAGANPAGSGLVISQVYGGGGNTNATYTHDFIEIFNPTSAGVSLEGWSLQYASATGTGNFGSTTTQLTPLSGSIEPGKYLLVREASTAAVGASLPEPYLTDDSPIAMAAAAGKVALVNTTTPLGCNGGSTTCTPASLATIVDLVGYGTGTSGANFYEGAGPAPTISSTLADFRNGSGCTDTDNNGTDLAAATPAPRTALADAHPCQVVGSTLSIDDVSVNEGDSGTTTFSFTVSLSAPAGPGGVTFDVATGDGTATDPGDYAAKSLPGQTILAGNSSYTFDVLVNGDTAVESNETFSVDVTNVTGATVADGHGQGTVVNDDVAACGSPYTPIHAIQGSGLAAPNPGNVTTEGVVVGDFEGTAANSGFFLQEPNADADPATSEGIFVFTGNANTVSGGDRVRVTGFAHERFDQTTINGSDNNAAAVPAANILVCSTGNDLAATDVTLPFQTADYPERYEGMLTRFTQPLVIAEYFNYDRFGEIVLANPLAGEPRPFSGTALDAPGDAANARTAANALSRITLDDNQSAQNPPVLRHPNGRPFSLGNLFRGGDHVQNAVGILGYDFNLYRIFPTGPAEYTATNPRPAAPDAVGGSIRVAAMNTLNFFVTLDTTASDTGPGPCGGNANLDCRGADADQPDEFNRQRTKLLAALTGLNGDVIGLNELENTPGVEPLESIVSGMPGYDFIHTGTIGTDAIKVGLIYRPAVVTPVGPYKVLTTAVDPRFIDTKSRPSLAQTFDVNATGARFTVVVNHLKSKGSACTDVGDPDLLDGQGNCSQTRRAAAEALVDWLATDPTGSGDPDFLIVGDLNSYAMEQTISEIKAGSDDTTGTGDDFTNLIAHFQGTFAYSYTFNGQAGYLDHALANDSLFSQVTGAAEWHINSDEPDVLDYDTSFKPPAQDALYEPDQYRTSDHDAVVIGLDPNAAPTVDAGGPYSVEEGSSAQVCAVGDDPDGDTFTYAWDLDGNGTYETSGRCATFTAPANSAPQQPNVTVRATDPGELSGTDSALVQITWPFTGLAAAYAAKAGDVAKVTFGLGGDQGLSILAEGYPTSVAHDCGSPGSATGGDPTTPGKTGLTYDTKKGVYTYSWSTTKLWKGTCRTFVLKLTDGTTHTAEFTFK